MPLTMKVLLGLALLLVVPFAVAQNNLGELLDAGAKRVSAEEFRREVAQHTVVGAIPWGEGRMELVYTNSGVIQGSVNLTGASSFGAPYISAIDGVWNIDDSGRICASMLIGRTSLPFRCQYWFKYKDDYFIADADSDRGAKLFRRTVKQ